MAMAGYTKLFNSILASTIWRAGDKTRLVWITLLAMADKRGVAEGSIPGLADMARVSIEDCELALLELQQTDRYSRSTEHEGRRIAPIDGGWRLLNHGKYREKLNADERREYLRQKQAEYREQRKQASTTVNNVSDTSTLLTQPDPSPSPSPKAKAEEQERPRPLISGESKPKTWGAIHGAHVSGFCDWVCLPEFIFAEFARKSAGAAYVQTWAAAVRSTWEGKTVGDNLKFWRDRWADSHTGKATGFAPKTGAEILAEAEANRVAQKARLL